MDNSKNIYLKNSSEDSAFRLSNGVVVLSLEQLLNAVKSDASVFYAHVNESKNDFTNWIRSVIGYSELADKVSIIKNREEFVSLLEKTIFEIKNDVFVSTTDVSSKDIVSPVVSSPSLASVASDVVSPVVSSPSLASVASDVVSPVVSSPVPVSSSESSSTGDSSISAVVELFNEMIFDFEDVFKNLINDLEQEIFSFDNSN